MTTEGTSVGPTGMATPFFIGAPWVPKFKGTGSNTSFMEWKQQIQAMLRAQAWTSEQRCDFLLSALEGDARREVVILEPEDRSTPELIFRHLEELFGDKISIALLRSMFFDCRQRPGETVRAFMLRLRELAQRLQRRDPRGLEQVDRLLRDQFLLGMYEGDLRQELKRQVRRDPDLTFDQVRREALYQEEDQQGEGWQTPVCSTTGRLGLSHREQTDWKQELRKELLQEMHDQISDLGKTLSEELRQGFRSQRTDYMERSSQHGREPWGGPAASRGPAPARPVRGTQPPVATSGPAFQWDSQGRPICCKCGGSGHISRYCRTDNNRRPPESSSAVGLVTGDPSQIEPHTVVGECPYVRVLFDDKPVDCLLDTGSQVTLMTEDFYRRLFPQQRVGARSDLGWLTLRAANGLEIPYVGYALIDITVGDVKLSQQGVVIAKDGTRGTTDPPILGMNIIGLCWNTLFSNPQGPADFLSTQPRRACQAWEVAFEDCRRVQASMKTSILQGTLRPAYRNPVKVPAQSEVVLWARVPSSLRGGQSALVEPLDARDSVCAARALTVVQKGRVPVRVRNLNPFPVCFHPYQQIATLFWGPLEVRGPDILTLTEVSPGVVEVGMCQTAQEPSKDLTALEALSMEGNGLSTFQQRQLLALLQKWEGVFAAHEEDYGRTGIVSHVIPTGDAAPIRERYRPIPPLLYQEMRGLLQGMLTSGIIRESTSPWAAPIVLVRKKDGTLRFCVDYRKLNAVTHRDAYPLPRIEEALTTLSKATYYSTMDLASGYWQVEVDARDREKTAFSTPVGLFEFERMPFGLCNAPATFQRLMQSCLGGLVSESLLVYLDDVIVFSPDFETHLTDLEAVFERLAKYGLKLRPAKCALFRERVKFLGHLVSAEGVAPDPDKVASVQDWVAPKTVRQVRSFLGFVGYYRRFIEGFACLARPLHALLVGTSNKGKRHSGPVNWTPACEQAFKVLKHKLIQAPILAFADFTLPFRLYTDASKGGLGAVLAQEQGGKERVVAYASRSLLPAERNDANYSSFKIELLALKWAVTEKFKDYLWGAVFTVFTDNNPLVHLQTAKLGAVEQRWAAQLANYHYDLKYRPGRENVNADVLSRLPLQGDHDGLVHFVDPGVITVSCNTQQSIWDPHYWRELQDKDQVCIRVRRYVERGEPPTVVEQTEETVEVIRLLRQWSRLQLRDGVIVRCVQDPATQEVYLQVLVPLQHRQAIWEEYHVRSGHLGVDKTQSILRRSFYWPQMERDATQWMASCERCVLRKARLEGRAPLVPIVTKAPLEILAVDYLTLSRPNDTYQYILVATDLFTKYAWAIPTRDQTAVTTARALWQYIIQPFGCPERLHSDQGANFESNLIKALFHYYGCKKSRTTPYHPQGNGACERFNQTLLSLLGTLEVEQQARWVQHLPERVQAYNNTIHASTGYTPFFLMFGRNARLPVEMTLGVWNGRERVTTEEWVQQHHERLALAYEKAGEQVRKASARGKRRYDRGTQALLLLPGERVLVQNSRSRGQGKLADRWDGQPYVVVEPAMEGGPTYRIRPEGKEGPVRTMHRNRLRVCTFQPQDLPVQPPQDPLDVPSDVPPKVSMEECLLLLWSSGYGLVPPLVQEGIQGVLDEQGLRRSSRENLGRLPVRYRQ